MQRKQGTGTEASDPPSSVLRPLPWRTPAVILVCGCLIATARLRAAFVGSDLFLTPMSLEHGWGRDVFSLALAIQMLLWGVGQPFAGAIADRFGASAGAVGGAILYALGLALMAYAQHAG